MKLVIPSEIQIGARTIRIRISEKLLEASESSASYTESLSIIRLSLIRGGKTRSTAEVFESLLHEVAHIIDGLYMRELEERQIGVLGSGLAQALLSLGIEPDFSEIPEEEL